MEEVVEKDSNLSLEIFDTHIQEFVQCFHGIFSEKGKLIGINEPSHEFFSKNNNAREDK